MDWSITDVVIFSIAAYLAVVSLMRLMRARRDQLVGQVRQRMQVEMRQPNRSESADQSREDAA